MYDLDKRPIHKETRCLVTLEFVCVVFFFFWFFFRVCVYVSEYSYGGPCVPLGLAVAAPGLGINHHDLSVASVTPYIYTQTLWQWESQKADKKKKTDDCSLDR